MTTLRRLVGAPGLGLRVLAGGAGLDGTVSWAAASELDDPAPYLEGAELVLTTGLNRHFDDVTSRAYVERLVAARAAGLGFGVGVAHDVVPPSLVEAAGATGLPLLEVDRPTPFIAVSKVLADLIAAERGERARRELAGLQALTAAAGTGGGADVVSRLARLVDGWVAVLDPRGAALHVAGGPPADPDRVTAVVETLRGRGRHASAVESDAAGRLVALPTASGGRAPNVLVVRTPAGRDVPASGLVAFAASLLGLDAGGAAGAPGPAVWARAALVASRVGAAPPPPPAGATAFVPGTRLRAVVVAADAGEVLGRVGASADPGDPVVVPLDDGVLVVVPEPAGQVLAELEGLAGGVSEAVPAARLTAAVTSARGLARRSRGGLVGPGRASSVQDLLGDALPGFAEGLLGPLRAAGGGPALVETLRVWLSLHGQTVAAAEAMGVHRHTVRERLRRAGTLLGRDLDDPQVRAELWLALTA